MIARRAHRLHFIEKGGTGLFHLSAVRVPLERPRPTNIGEEHFRCWRLLTAPAAHITKTQ